MGEGVPTAIPPAEGGPTSDPVEQALAAGVTEASRAGRWDVVAILAKELEARRLARTDSNVVSLPVKASKRADRR